METLDFVEDLANSSAKLLIAFILSMHKKRKIRGLECWGGRPGIVVPLNLLDEFEHRWAYAFAFGAITNTLFDILTGFDGQGASNAVPRAERVLWSFWRAFEVCVNFFPFFSCLYTENVLLGSVLGAAYATMWFGIKLFAAIDCADPVPKFVPYMTIISQTPTLLCLAFLVLKFVWTFVLYMRGQHKGSHLQRIEDSVVFPFQMHYVRSLLRKPPPAVDWHSKEVSFFEKVKLYYKKYYYDDRCDFKYSTRIMCTMMIVLMGSYQMGVFQMYFSSVARQGLGGLAEQLINNTNIIPVNSTRGFKQNVESVLALMGVSWSISTGVAFLVASIGLTGSLSSYRTHLLSLYRGDRSFYPRDYQVPSAEYISNSMKYPGYQIAFAIWGNIIVVLVVLLISLLISFIFILPVINNNWTSVLFVAEVMLLPLAVSLIMRLIQVLIARRCFLQQKLTDENKDKPLAIDNRRVYHVADYFFFVANVAVGFFSCLLRIGKGLVIGLFYLSRLDRCVLMSGWEKADTGFTSYIGMLELEHAHNHPAMRVFVHIMNGILPGRYVPAYDSSRCSFTTLRDNHRKEEGIIQVTDEKSEDSISRIEHQGTEKLTGIQGTNHRRARQRWLLAYTLIRNPQLIQYRHLLDTDENDHEKDHKTLEKDEEYLLLKATVQTIEMTYGVKAHEFETKLDVIEKEIDLVHDPSSNKVDMVKLKEISFQDLEQKQTPKKVYLEDQRKSSAGSSKGGHLHRVFSLPKNKVHDVDETATDAISETLTSDYDLALVERELEKIALPPVNSEGGDTVQKLNLSEKDTLVVSIDNEKVNVEEKAWPSSEGGLTNPGLALDINDYRDNTKVPKAKDDLLINVTEL